MNWGAVPDWIAGFGGLGSVAIAFLVLREAKRIRENTLFHSLISLWNQVNNDAVQTGFAKKWGDVYACKFDEGKLTGDCSLVFWSLINALQFTWTLAKDGLLHEFYLRHQAPGWFYGLKPKRDFLLKFMDENYVDPEFRDLFATLTSAPDVDEAKRLFAVAYKAAR